MNEEVQQIKDKIDIVSLIGESVGLKKSGRNYKGLCPFHGEKTPSFMVSADLQIFKCFGCGAGGDAFSFLMQREGLEFREALEQLAVRAGVKIKKFESNTSEDKRRERLFSANEMAARFYNFLLTKHPSGKIALEYLNKQRGLSGATIEKFQLGYAPNSNDALTQFLLKKEFSQSEILEAGLALRSDRNNSFYDRFRARVVFPLVDSRDRVLGFTGRLLVDLAGAPKYLNSPETAIFSKSRFLFGLNLARVAIKKAGRVVVVEGQMDLVSNVQGGVENIVATSGTALTPAQIQILAKLAKEVVFSFDADSAGQKALERAVEICEAEGLVSLVAKLPPGAKDPDEAVKKFAADWQKNLANPISFYDYYFGLHTEGILQSDSLSKRRAVEKLLPLLAKISDPLTKASYVKKLSQSLDLEDKFVQEALSQMERKVTESKAAGEKTLSWKYLETLPGLERAEVLRRYLLCLALRFNFDLVKKSLAKVPQKDFESSQLLPSFLLIKEAFVNHQRTFKVINLREGLDEAARKIYDELFLLDLGEMETDFESQEKEMTVVVSELKRETLKAEVKQLLSRIRKAEQDSDGAELKQLQEKLNGLYQKLKT